ncbi:MAG: hypothetical protein ACFCVK_13445 [Acidimicrobiales bacterium]
MPTINEPTLTVRPVDGRPGQRRVVVDYELACEPDDPMAGAEAVEHVLVHAVDEHDAAVRPAGGPVLELQDRLVLTPGRRRRTLEGLVDRVDLDVQQDWWSTDHGGSPQPIAEWLDHLTAEIRLRVADEPVVGATTPVVTGSWGALGRD